MPTVRPFAALRYDEAVAGPLDRLVAPPFIQGKFTHLVDVFLENTREALAAPPAKRRA